MATKLCQYARRVVISIGDKDRQQRIQFTQRNIQCLETQIDWQL